MTTFHDNKYWQDAYTALLDLYDFSDQHESLATAKDMGLEVLSTIADGIIRRDRRERDMKLRDAAGLVAGVRSYLSVAWGLEMLDDDTFGKLDGAYEQLQNGLPK